MVVVEFVSVELQSWGRLERRAQDVFHCVEIAGMVVLSRVGTLRIDTRVAEAQKADFGG